MAHGKYENWSKEDLIARIRQMEKALKGPATPSGPSLLDPPAQSIELGSPETSPDVSPSPALSTPSTNKPTKGQKAFNFSAHPRRKIALKFSYAGAHYNGLEYQKSPTPLPTVEEVLWKALVHARLVDPEQGFDGVGWEKCGRTDRGVSAAGQVVSFWIRSGIKQKQESKEQFEKSEDAGKDVSKAASEQEQSALEGDFGTLSISDEAPTNGSHPSASTPKSTRTHPPTSETQDSHNIHDADKAELPYLSTLNSLLPPTLRVHAWSPVSPSFSARFSCQHRHYKYFFTGKGLDIERMMEGAKRLVGEWDFRNLCRVDPGKQMTSWKRRILRAEINKVEEYPFVKTVPASVPSDLPPPSGENQMYVFNLVGTAFLYNQVRHIMALLFLIGARLESPSLITSLLNVDPKNPITPFQQDESLEVVETKPEYQMADSLPLVLWECAFSNVDVQWRTDKGLSRVYDSTLSTPSGQDSGMVLTQRALSANLPTQMILAHERTLIHTALSQHFLIAALSHHHPSPTYLPLIPSNTQIPEGTVLGVPLGGGTEKRGARYVPVLNRKRGDHVEVINQRWRDGKGKRRMERRALGDGGAAVADMDE